MKRFDEPVRRYVFLDLFLHTDISSVVRQASTFISAFMKTFTNIFYEHLDERLCRASARDARCATASGSPWTS